jgi:starvation-inducible DNA-binding protein
MDLGFTPTVTASLQRLLSVTYVMMLMSQKFHWDIVGPHFGPLHKLYQKHYEYYFELIDSTAERIRQLGECPYNSPDDIMSAEIPYQAYSELDEYSQLSLYASALSVFIQIVREITMEANQTIDFATVNWLSGVLEFLEKEAWIVDSIINMPVSDSDESKMRVSVTYNNVEKLLSKGK